MELFFDCSPRAHSEELVAKRQPKYVDPRVRFNARERFVHYWTNIHQWNHPYEVIEKLGVRYRGGVILPQVFTPLWRKQIKNVKAPRVAKTQIKLDYQSNIYDCLEDEAWRGKLSFFSGYDYTEEEEVAVEEPQKKVKKTFDFKSYYQLLRLIKHQASVRKHTVKVRNQELLLALKEKIRVLREKRITPDVFRSKMINQQIFADKVFGCYRQQYIDQDIKNHGHSIVNDYFRDKREQQRFDSCLAWEAYVQKCNRDVVILDIQQPVETFDLDQPVESFELEPQMMAAQGEKECPEIISQSNTLQESQRGASQGQPAVKVPRKKRVYNKLASAESSMEYADMTDRFFPHITTEWKGSSEHPRHHEILNLTLPLDFVVKHPNAANCVLFNSYSYWDGDMEIKIMVNSNKFQVGQLQMSWYYGQDYEKNFERRSNVFTASQQAHCLVSASTSNEGILYIPFRYYKPKMGTKNRVDDPGHLNMGKLSVRVINPLSSPSASYNACTFTISFRFINSNFSGMIARDLGKIEPNMFAIRAATRVLEELDADPQRDNPPVVRPPNPIVPWSAHSWSVGDRLTEPINSLRLQGPGQTPHPAEVTPEVDEMSVKNIVNTFGLFRIVQWDANHRTGDLLFSMDGAPMQPNSSYYSDKFDDTICYAMPPISVLANLYAYWRGSLELRLDAITSPFHTGRLLLAYIPRVMGTPTFEQAKSSPHMIIDLQGENRQFVFKVPYIADRPWWHNRSFNNVLPPSRIYCFVMNELVPMDSVVNSVDINIYMRGCDDFEFSIPVTPHIGLSTYNARVIIPDYDLARTKEGYMPMYTGTWHRFVDTDKPNETRQLTMLRYGNVTEHVTEFDGLRKGVVYTPDETKNGEIIRGKNNVTSWYIVGIDVDMQGDFCPYAAYFTDRRRAANYALTYRRKWVSTWTEDSGWFDNPKGVRRDKPIYFKRVSDEGFEVLEANMDERKAVTTTCEAGVLDEVQSTSSGLLTFGESFADLKSLMRRYQLYMSVDKHLDVTSGNKRQKVKVPLLPQGIPRSDIDLNVDVYNMNREGIIPIIASAYRFYRGGLRFRMVWRSSWDCAIRVEHRPDERLRDLSTSVGQEHSSYFNDGYAFMVQHTSTNKVLEFEVPFYQCGVLGLLQNPKIGQDLESYHFSLGNLYFSFVCQNNLKVEFDLYYSLADDCRFSVFQGFPPMMLAPNHTMKLYPQMGLFGDIKEVWANAKEGVSKFNKTMDKVDDILPDVDRSEPVSELDQKKESIITWITQKVPDNLKSAMIGGVSQIFHCFINPTVKTICLAFTSFVAQIGILQTKLFSTFHKYMSIILNFILRRNKDEEESSSLVSEGKESPLMAPVLEANMAEEDRQLTKAKAGIISTIVTGVAAAFGSVGRFPKTVPDFFRKSWDNLGKFTLTSNALCRFFENNLCWITDCYKWVLSRICPNRALATELEGADEELKEFVAEALLVTSEVNARKVELNPRWNLKVYQCAAKASVLYMRMSTVKDAPKTPALYHLMQQVMKKRDHLIKFQLSPPVRFEPYVICIAGKSNIGKSHFLQQVGKEILRAINYKTYEELVFTRSPGNAYWNTLRNQPICLYDDFVAIGQEYGLQQASELFCLKSRAVFNPPQASIEEKHIRYNPLLVCLATNDPFPKVAGVTNNEAFYRRRDVLINAEPNHQYYAEKKVDVEKGCPKNFKTKDIEKFQHLFFRLAENVKECTTEYGDKITYEQLIEHLVAEFKVFYDREMELYVKALAEAYEFYPDDDEDCFSIAAEIASRAHHVDEVNKYRFSNIMELKVFLSEAATLVKKDEDPNIVPIFTGLRTLYAFDKKYTTDIVLSNKLLVTYAVNHGLFGLSLKPSEEKGKGFVVQKDFQKKGVVNVLTHWCSKLGVLKPKVDQKKDSASSSLEANSGEIEICTHHSFHDSMSYERDDELNINSMGKFTDEATGLVIKEQCCDTELCKWRDKKELERDMASWKNNRYATDRKHYFTVGNWGRLPRFFQPEKPKKDHSPVYLNNVNRQVETWSQWCMRLLKGLPGLLWTGLKWAAHIVGAVGVIFGTIGLVKNIWNPEDVGVRLNQKMIEKDQIYKISYDQALGQKDADLVINNELMKQQHFVQKYNEENGFSILNNQESQMHVSGDYKVASKIKPTNVKEVAIKLVANMAKEHEYTLIKLIRRNTMFIEAVYNGKVISGRIIGLVGHYALAIDHYHDKLSLLPEGTKVYLNGPDFSVEVNYDDLAYSKFENSSLGYYKLPKSIAPFKNLLKHMARQKEHINVGPVSKLVEVTKTDVLITPEYCERISEVTVPASNGFQQFIVPDGYKYARGGRGVCGSILLSDHLPRPIYGIHVAGDIGGKIGISEALTYEQFKHLEDEVVIRDVIEPNMQDWSPGFMKPNSNCIVLGIVPKVFAHAEVGKSGVIPTECHGEIFEPYCEPPVLHPGDHRIKDNPFSPMQAGVDKHGLVPNNFPSEYVELAYQDLKNLVLAKVKPVRHEVGKLDMSTAVIGNHEFPGYEKIDLKTSEGYPYVACRTGKDYNKMWLLNITQDDQNNYHYEGCDDMLTEIMESKEQQRLNRELPHTVFVDCLKDQKLPKEKVLVPGKVRVFSISPLDYTIQSRQYLMDFSVAYKEARLKVEHAVGIDVNSLEWTAMVLELLNVSGKIFTADYSNFGPTLNAICGIKAFQIMREWYKFYGDLNTDNDLIREMLGYEVVYSTHLVFGTLYRTMCGLPSGGPLTVVQNSLVNCLYMRIAWMHIMNLIKERVSLEITQPVNMSMSSFHKHVKFFVYGDDIIGAVSDEASEIFNCSTIADALGFYKISIKNATKLEQVVKYQSLLDPETSFLKHTFVLHPYRKGLFLAALDHHSVEDTINWTYKTWANKLREASLDASDACIRNAFGHGEVYFNQLRDRIFEYWQRKGEHLTTPTWKEIDEQNYVL